MINKNLKQLDQTVEDINEDKQTRPRTGQTEQRKEFDPEDDQKRKKTNLTVTAIAIGFSLVLILICWIFIIIMADKYSQRAGNLWVFSILMTAGLDFILVELTVLYYSSKTVYNKELDLREAKFSQHEIQK